VSPVVDSQSGGLSLTHLILFQTQRLELLLHQGLFGVIYFKKTTLSADTPSHLAYPGGTAPLAVSVWKSYLSREDKVVCLQH